MCYVYLKEKETSKKFKSERNNFCLREGVKKSVMCRALEERAVIMYSCKQYMHCNLL